MQRGPTRRGFLIAPTDEASLPTPDNPSSADDDDSIRRIREAEAAVLERARVIARGIARRVRRVLEGKDGPGGRT